MTRRTVDAVGVIVLVALCAWGMAGFELRMARYHSDDSPVHYAHAFAAPERYVHDVTIGVPTPVVLPSRVLTSAMVWGPALLWKHAGVDPYRVTRALTALQGLLLGASIYLLAVVLTARRDLALMAALAAFVSAPWVWSPANYGNDAAWNFIPYAANLATGLLVIALAAAAARRTVASLVLIAAGGLVHPLLGLQAAVTLAAYWLMPDPGARRSGAQPLVGLLVVASVFMLPAAWGALLTPDPLPAGELLPALRLNAHIFPWRVAGWWIASAQQTVAFIVLSAAAWHTAGRQVTERRLWPASLACALIFSIAHVMGAFVGQPSLLSLVGLRAWMWPVLLSLPVVLLGFWRTLDSGSLPGRFAALALLVMPFVAGRYAVPLPLVVAMAAAWLAPLARVRASRMVLETVSWCSAFAWIGLVALVPQNAARSEAEAAVIWRMLAGAVDRPDPSLVLLLPIVMTLVTYLASSWRADGPVASRRISVIRVAGVLGAAAFVVASARASAADSTRPGSSVHYLLDAERWAREHTPADATFLLLEDGWRTMAARAGVEPFTRESYAYVAPRAAEEWRLRLLSYYGVGVEWATATRGPSLQRYQRERFRATTEADLLRFSDMSAATHAVIPVCYPQTDRVVFDLPLAYENPCFRIYLISPAVIDAERRREDVSARALLAQARFATGFARTNLQAEVRAPGTAMVEDALGRFERVLRFGPSARPTLPSAAIDLGSGTLAVWARLRTPLPDYVDLIRVNANNDLYLYLTAGQFHLLFGGKLIGAAPVTVDEAWHHYAVVWQNREQHLYIDGHLRLSGQEAAPVGPVSLVALGWLGDRDGEQWNGDIGHVVTFDRPLAAGEIRSLTSYPRRP